MKALSEYFLMLVFTLLLNRVHVFVNFMFKLCGQRKLHGSERVRVRAKVNDNRPRTNFHLNYPKLSPFQNTPSPRKANKQTNKQTNKLLYGWRAVQASEN